METTNIERIQRRLVCILVDGERLRRQAEPVRADAEGYLPPDMDELKAIIDDITLSVSELYRLLPGGLLPTAATLRAIEREAAEATVRCTAKGTQSRRQAR
jgi:hypothetical protein